MTGAADLGHFMKKVREKARQVANVFRAKRNLPTQARIDGSGQASLREMYRYTEGGFVATGAAIWDAELKQHVFDINRQRSHDQTIGNGA